MTDALPAGRPFLSRPGRPGPFGALMDEYARAAEDFCRTVEALSPDAFALERESPDPDTRSPRSVAAHACGAAWGYADYIRRVRGLSTTPRPDLSGAALSSPRATRSRLVDALRYTEEALLGLEGLDDAGLATLRFEVRWGPTYDPEMILEHGIVHLLRHRRQLERWPKAT